ncbi:CCA tRNA nucleotidyltransferase [Candidatus Micrarchaeota archaeon]|nr:CCA tRNA nucleotidyltransferase [Candidatus Micrarchaeota archaeon]
MKKRIQKIKEKVLKEIIPSKEEIIKENEIKDKIIKKINSIKGKHIEAILAGSLSRNTHLKDDKDIDIFVLFDKKMEKKEFIKEGLKIAKKIAGKNWEIDFGEHPYVKTEIEGHKVELIPSYKIESTQEMLSSVDRTPFHTNFIQEKLKENQRNEIRLMKKFLKGIECYGAELKVQGFSGYLAELVILKYKTFENALKKISLWKERKVISLTEKTNAKKEKELMQKFNNSLIFIDPTDERRNTAAAVSKEVYEKLKKQAKKFLNKPSISFFFPKPVKILTKKEFREKNKNKNIILVESAYEKIHEDVTFGQMRRFLGKLKKELEKNDFTVLRERFWSDEKKKMLLLVEVKESKLGKEKMIKGPPETMKKHAEKFIEKHGKKKTKKIKGHYHAIVKRKHLKAESVVKEFIEKQIKVNPKKFLSKRMKKRHEIYSGKKLEKIYKEKEVQEFLSKYLKEK